VGAEVRLKAIIDLQADRFKKGIDNVNKKLKNFEYKVTEVSQKGKTGFASMGKAFQAGNFKKGIDDASKKLGELKNKTVETSQKGQSGFGKMGKAFAAFGSMFAGGMIASVVIDALTKIAAKIAQVVVGLIKLANQVEESENLFIVSMGRMEGVARKWSDNLSKALGLNAFEVRKNVATFNTMSDSMGLSEEKALDLSQPMTKLTYDISSFYNQPT
jgi:hypothetical protein